MNNKYKFVLFVFLFALTLILSSNTAYAGQATGVLDTNASGTNSCTSLSGWAWDPDFPNDATTVHVYENGNFYTVLNASELRDDLPGNHLHGFGMMIPSAWKDGANHTINLYAIDLNGEGNPNLIFSPAQIYCPPSAPTLTSLTINNNIVKPDGVTKYNIDLSASDSSGAANIQYMYALVNYQGENAGNHAGYLTWAYAANPWPGAKDVTVCTGAGGTAVIQPGVYGAEKMELHSCNVVDNGNSRSITYTVSFNPSFISTTTNDISGYAYNKNNLAVGWTNFQTNFNLAPRVAPTVNLTLSSNSVRADNVTKYDIIVAGTNPAGAADITWQEALINYQGGNVGTFRGFLVYNPVPGAYFSSNAYTDIRTCSGIGGEAGVYPGTSYGSQYIHLDSCATTDSGNTRTTKFTVRFDTAFTSPLTGNDISAYTHDGPSGLNSGWVNFDTNFSLTTVSPTLAPDLKCNGIDSCTVTSGDSATLSWDAVTNATSCSLLANGLDTGKGSIASTTFATPILIGTANEITVITYELNCIGAGSLQASDKATLSIPGILITEYAPVLTCTNSSGQAVGMGPATPCMVNVGDFVTFSGSNVGEGCKLFKEGNQHIDTGARVNIDKNSLVFGPITSSFPAGYYSIGCFGASGEIINYTPAPEIKLTPLMTCNNSLSTPCNVALNQPFTLKYNLTNNSQFQGHTCAVYKSNINGTPTHTRVGIPSSILDKFVTILDTLDATNTPNASTYYGVECWEPSKPSIIKAALGSPEVKIPILPKPVITCVKEANGANCNIEAGEIRPGESAKLSWALVKNATSCLLLKNGVDTGKGTIGPATISTGPLAFTDGAGTSPSSRFVNYDLKCTGPGGTGTGGTFAVVRPALISKPVVANITISSNAVVTNGTIYDVTETVTDTSGFANIDSVQMNINGSTASGNINSLRGSYIWAPNVATLASAFGLTTLPADSFVNCAGGGAATQFGGSGSEFSFLNDCSASGSGNTRTVVFKIGFDPAFTTPATNNDIDGIAHNVHGEFATSVNFDLNFSVSATPPPDTTLPTVSVTAPSAGANVSGLSVTVSGSASDDVGVVGVQFKLDGANLGSEDTSSPYSTNWNATTTNNGSHNISALARDAAGNVKISSSVSVNVNNVVADTTPPTVSVTAPSGGATVSGTSTSVTATATDAVGVVGVQFKLDGTNLGTEDTSSPYSTTWNTTSATNGTHALTAHARDAAGNTTVSSSVTVTVSNTTTPPADTTLPTVSLSAPASGATVSGTSTTVSATATDNIGVSGVQFKIDGTNLGVEDTTSPYSITWDTTSATNGSHSLTAVARDAAGNSKTSNARSVTVNNITTPPADTTAPTVSITAPASGATVSGTSNTVSASASDNVGVSGVTFKVDGTTIGSEDTTSPYSVTLNTTTLTNAAHSITAVARDAAGNTTTSGTVTVTVNNVTTPPADTTAPTVSITAPAASATVSGTSTTVSATASDAVGVVGVQFKLDGANLGTEDTSSPYSTTWNTTSATNGTHALTAHARDAAGNTTTSNSRTVTVSNVTADTTLPTVSVTAPAAGATVSGSSVSLTASASDNIGVVGVQFKVDGANRGSEDTSSPYSKTWDTTTATNGTHTITAVARDAAGNTKTSTSVTVTVNNVLDTTAPTVSITAPASGATVSGSSVSLNATASDNIAVVGVQFKVDGANRGSEDTSAPYSKNWDTTTVANGTHTITAVARDAAGNTKTSTAVTVTVTGSTAEADSQNFLVAAAVLMGDAVIDVFDFFSSLLSF